MLKRAAGLEMRGPHLQKGVVLLSPSEPGKIEQDPGFFGFFRPAIPPQSSARVCTVENETGHALGVSGRVFYCDRSAPARAKQRKLPERSSFDDTFKILNPILE